MENQKLLEELQSLSKEDRETLFKEVEKLDNSKALSVYEGKFYISDGFVEDEGYGDRETVYLVEVGEVRDNGYLYLKEWSVSDSGGYLSAMVEKSTNDVEDIVKGVGSFECMTECTEEDFRHCWQVTIGRNLPSFTLPSLISDPALDPDYRAWLKNKKG